MPSILAWLLAAMVLCSIVVALVGIWRALTFDDTRGFDDDEWFLP